MSFIVTGIIAGGAALVGAWSANNTGKKAARASRRGATTAANATIQSTEMQIAEIQRQFDYQQTVLQPMIQRQNAAAGQFSNMLGINANAPRPANAVTSQQINETLDLNKNMYGKGKQFANRDEAFQSLLARDQGASMNRDSSGAFVDRNLSTKKLASSSGYGKAVRGNLQAGTSAANDPYRNFVKGNSVATKQNLAQSVSERSLFDKRSGVNLADGAASVGVYGENFEESAGYGFAVEQMNDAVSKRNSAGGNFGGAAIKEAARYANGLANQEYYNWAQGRTSDLNRLGAAESSDAYRDDSFAQFDESRMDSAISAEDSYRARAKETDVLRGDSAYENYLGRKAGDATRLDNVALHNDQLQAADLQRQDGAYYNYLNNLSGVAGFGNASGQAVSTSQAAGSQTANAYAGQGNSLSSIYSNNGNNQAGIAYRQGADTNNAIQAGAGNWITQRAAQAA